MERGELSEEARNSKCSCRKFNFDAPLLSTRRTGGYAGEELSCRSSQGFASDRVPFSWEQAPGKPRNLERDDIHDENENTPRLRLPPCLWQLQSAEATNNDYPYNDVDDHAVLADFDDSCDGNNGGDDAAFSDAMDVLSLSEAIDIVTKAEKDHELDGLKLKFAESSGKESPNYMIKRFLRDATALATSSALTFSKSFNKRLPKPSDYPEACGSNVVSQSCASPKGCGLESLFSWRMKHKLCSIKSPIRQESVNVQPQSRAKQKKHLCSSANALISNVDKRRTRD
ncbi:hypothetical protein F2P56_008290 [Juglans regia]|uniref:Uncharacterized protein n=2 Tax=Juglans regia TaxID=51240 RepID=A0A833XUX9_JUGRE|nr:uncharacterized protein LOC108995138 [Juglans regia]KAF5471502.1 hypothetical protein F2P56_008290 [Juglans regia]